MIPKLLTKLINDKRYQHIFEYYYDFIFDFTTDYSDEPFRTTCPITIVARDGGGGIYAIFGEGDVEGLPVAYISSEGQFEIIAKSFNSLISLIVQFPFWGDVLTFSGNLRIEDMEQMVELLKMDSPEFRPDIQKVTTQIIEELGENISETTIEEMRNILLKTYDFQVYSTRDNNLYESMIGKATPQECRLWNKYKTEEL